MATGRIVQISPPPPGWLLVRMERTDGLVWFEPLAGFALIEDDDGYRHIEPLEVVPAEAHVGLADGAVLGYAIPGQPRIDWLAVAIEGQDMIEYSLDQCEERLWIPAGYCRNLSLQHVLKALADQRVRDRRSSCPFRHSSPVRTSRMARPRWRFRRQRLRR